MALAQDRLRAYVLLVTPEGLESDGELERAAREIPGVQRVLDPRGERAERFGALTSGHVVLFDAQGRQRFAGGLTPARGHEGDSAGRSAALALLDGHAPALPRGPVFGCALRAAH